MSKIHFHVRFLRVLLVVYQIHTTFIIWVVKHCCFRLVKIFVVKTIQFKSFCPHTISNVSLHFSLSRRHYLLALGAIFFTTLLALCPYKYGLKSSISWFKISLSGSKSAYFSGEFWNEKKTLLRRHIHKNAYYCITESIGNI